MHRQKRPDRGIRLLNAVEKRPGNFHRRDFARFQPAQKFGTPEQR